MEHSKVDDILDQENSTGEEASSRHPVVLPERRRPCFEKKGVGAQVGKVLGTIYIKGPEGGVIGERVGMAVEKAAVKAGTKVMEKQLQEGDLDGPTMDLM